MKRYLYIISFLILIFYQYSYSYENINVVAKLYETNGYNFFPNTETFVLYNNKQVIHEVFTIDDEPIKKYKQVTLNENEFNNLKRKLFEDTCFSSLDSFYFFLSRTHVPQNLIKIGNKSVSIRNIFRVSDYDYSAFEEIKCFKELFDFFVFYEHKDETEWIPEYVLVIISPSEFDPDALNWPDYLPTLKSSKLEPKYNRYTNTLIIEYDKWIKFYSICLQKEISCFIQQGKKWNLSWFKVLLPHEYIDYGIRVHE